eukprot:6476453-Amphidinium_carterae.1
MLAVLASLQHQEGYFGSDHNLSIIVAVAQERGSARGQHEICPLRQVLEVKHIGVLRHGF